MPITRPVPPEGRELPNQIGRYEILCRLGQGGMATVYLGRAVGPAGFERLFAIKMIHEHLCSSKAFVGMFLEEARLAARLYHPNIAPVYEVSEDQGRYFIAMDYVSGETLASVMARMWNERQWFPIDLAAHLALNVAEALHAAHEIRDASGKMLGVIHRDVSPQNVLVGYDGIVRVVDFGVAKARDQVSYTLPGTQKGTLAYMAPEQFTEATLDRRADVFSLGVVLWEMTVGKRLFKGKTDVITADKVRATVVPRPTTIHESYPEALERIVLKALNKNPGDRQQTARALGDELREFLIGGAAPHSPAQVEQLMCDLFADRHEKKLEMERQALTASSVETFEYAAASDQGALGISPDAELSDGEVSDEPKPSEDLPEPLPQGARLVDPFIEPTVLEEVSTTARLTRPALNADANPDPSPNPGRDVPARDVLTRDVLTRDVTAPPPPTAIALRNTEPGAKRSVDPEAEEAESNESRPRPENDLSLGLSALGDGTPSDSVPSSITAVRPFVSSTAGARASKRALVIGAAVAALAVLAALVSSIRSTREPPSSTPVAARSPPPPQGPPPHPGAQPAQTTIRFKLHPEDAIIHVDGRVHTGDLVVDASPQPYFVMVSAPGFAPAWQMVTGERSRNVEIKLRRNRVPDLEPAAPVPSSATPRPDRAERRPETKPPKRERKSRVLITEDDL